MHIAAGKLRMFFAWMAFSICGLVPFQSHAADWVYLYDDGITCQWSGNQIGGDVWTVDAAWLQGRI